MPSDGSIAVNASAYLVLAVDISRRQKANASAYVLFAVTIR